MNAEDPVYKTHIPGHIVARAILSEVININLKE